MYTVIIIAAKEKRKVERMDIRTAHLNVMMKEEVIIKIEFFVFIKVVKGEDYESEAKI
jgi:hypothetical protein